MPIIFDGIQVRDPWNLLVREFVSINADIVRLKRRKLNCVPVVGLQPLIYRIAFVARWITNREHPIVAVRDRRPGGIKVFVGDIRFVRFFNDD